MKGSSLGYLLKTGFKNVYMNRLMSFASIGVLVACLMLIGSAVLLSLNMQVIVGAVEDENEMVAFLDMDLSDSQIQQIGNEISQIPEILTSTPPRRRGKRKRKSGALPARWLRPTWTATTLGQFSPTPTALN